MTPVAFEALRQVAVRLREIERVQQMGRALLADLDLHIKWSLRSRLSEAREFLASDLKPLAQQIEHALEQEDHLHAK